MTSRVANHARIYDAFAFLVTIIVIALDQWTKFLVVTYLSPPESRSISVVSQYLILYYIQNSGAAFSMLKNTTVLVVLIAVAMLVVGYIYLRILNSGPLYYKIIFGLIIGGALGNVIDRIHNGGYVVDFIAFRIPQINFYFAIFNVADACITIGVLLLFVFIFFSRRSHDEKHVTEENTSQETVSNK
ncbi:MAG: signal peptidase II [Ktedonobacteraceae bacterium]